MKCADKIRTLLRSPKYRDDGLTFNQLSALTGHPMKTVTSAVENMPDKYVAGWTKDRHVRGRYAKVIKVVIPPLDAAPPPKGGGA